MVCNLCQMQYVGRRKTPFNIRLNTKRKDTNCNSVVTNLIDMRHSLLWNKLITQLILTKIKIILTRREDFRILKLNTLLPIGLNQELKFRFDIYFVLNSDYHLLTIAARKKISLLIAHYEKNIAKKPA